MQKYLLIALGGALGSIARYWVGATVTNRLGARFPYGTLAINLTACVLIGFALTFLGKRAGMSGSGGIRGGVQYVFHLRVGDDVAVADGWVSDGGALCIRQPDSGAGRGVVRHAGRGVSVVTAREKENLC